MVVRTVRSVLEASAAVIGIRSGTEEPAHTVERVENGVEIRAYGPRVAAETTVEGADEAARSEGFRRLAGYIFGGNDRDIKIAMTAPVGQHPGGVRGEQIAMTAPVAQQRDDNGEWVIQFFMPADKTLATLPTPENSAVRLVDVPAAAIAVRRFSGRASHEVVASQTDALLKSLEGTDFRPSGIPAAWFYDPPWTVPFLRRNEIAVTVTRG